MVVRRVKIRKYININGENYRITRHGRERFIERIQEGLTDDEMIMIALNGMDGVAFFWERDGWNPYVCDGYALVTTYRVPHLINTAPLIKVIGGC